MSVITEAIDQVVSRYKIGSDLLLNVHTNSLSCRDTSIELEHRLVQLLVYFLNHQGVVLERDLLLRNIWPGKVVNEDSLAVAVSHLRKALGDSARSPQFIKTIPGIGYQFIGSAEPLSKSELAPAPGVKLSRKQKLSFTLPVLLSIAAILAVAIGLFFYQRASTTTPSAAIGDGLEEEQREAQQLLSQYDPDAWRLAIKKFRDLINRQGESAESYLGIADAKVKLLGEKLALKENCQEVIGLLQKSLSLNMNLATAQRSLANATFWCQRDYALAEQYYQAALKLDPGDDLTPMFYAQFLLSQQRFAESLQQVELSRSLNPLNYSLPNVVWIYQMHLRDDLALQELQRILTTEPDNRYYHISAQRIFNRMGDADKTFEQWLWLMKDAGFSDGDLASAQQTFARGGLPDLNRWLLLRKEPVDLGEYSPPLSWARYALVAGQYDLALDYLEAAYEQRQSPLLWARVDPAYEAVRKHPRFQKILVQLSLPENK